MLHSSRRPWPVEAPGSYSCTPSPRMVLRSNPLVITLLRPLRFGRPYCVPPILFSLRWGAHPFSFENIVRAAPASELLPLFQKIFRMAPAPPNSPRLSPQSISAPHAGGEYRPDSEKRYGQNYQSNPSCVRRMLQIRFTHTSPLYRHTRAISPPSPHFIFLLHRAIFPSSGRFTGPSTKRRSDEDPALLNFLNRSNSNVR